MRICKRMFLVGALAFAVQAAAQVSWENSLVENGNFAQGGATAAGWNTGFFDGAKGSVQRISTGDAAHPNALVLKFTAPAKGLIQVESKPFRLPVNGPRRIRLVTEHNGGGLIQIRFFSVEKGKGLVWLKRADGSPVKLEQVLKPGKDWNKTVSEWTLSKERLAQNLFANVVIMSWASKTELKVSSISLQFNKLPAAPAAKSVPAPKTAPVVKAAQP